MKLDETPSSAARRPYSTPVLVVYGTIEALTRNVGTISTDGITGSQLI